MFKIGCFIYPSELSEKVEKRLRQDKSLKIVFGIKEQNYSKEAKFVGSNCDLFVSIGFHKIFGLNILKLPRLGTINLHSGKLPAYKGRNVLTAALINDEKEFGLTVHWVDRGIDTGDIILQETYPITDEDDYKSLLAKSYEKGAELLYNAIKCIQKGIASRRPQEGGFYCQPRTMKDICIDWTKSGREIFNFIRALCFPNPVARAFIGDREIKINKVHFEKDSGHLIKTGLYIPVGTVIDDNLVKVVDGYLKLIQYEGEIKKGDVLCSTDRLLRI